MLIDSYTAPASTPDAIWSTTWTPSRAGVYSLAAVITDTNDLTATSPINTVYVDLADPTVSITAETITAAAVGERWQLYPVGAQPRTTARWIR